MCRTFLTTKFQLHHEGCNQLFFSLEPTDEDGKLEFFVEETILATYDRADEEINSIVCDLSLDELEYIGKQFLEAVAFERKQLQEHASEEAKCKQEDYESAEKALHGMEAPMTDEEREKYFIANALLRNHGDRKAAASELNMSERTFYRKASKYGII